MVDITKLATLVQSSPLPAWLATSKGACVYANLALERLTGLDSDQINQTDWPSFLLEEDRAAAMASWQSALAIGAPKHWHGATSTSSMTHIAITEELNGNAVEWLEKVSDEENRKR